MDRRKYDARITSVFDTIGSCLVDIFYNNHYLCARDRVRQGAEKSITDAYRNAVSYYVDGVSNSIHHYTTVVNKLFEYYRRNGNNSVLLFSDFEDRFLACLIPAKYYRDFSSKQKDSTLHEVIVKTIAEFSRIILSADMLRRIIDDHMNVANITLLQDSVMDIFLLQHEEYHSRFAKKIVEARGVRVGGEVLEKLKVAYVDEKKMRCELEADRERAVDIIGGLTAHISQMEVELRQARETISELRKQAVRSAEHAHRSYESRKTSPEPRFTVVEPTRVPPVNTVQTQSSTQASVSQSPVLVPEPSPEIIDYAQQDEFSELSDEELYKKQREAVAALRAQPLPVIDDEDPGFGFA